MPIQIKRVQVTGFKELDEALEALADEKGETWKRKAMVVAGEAAMKPVLLMAKSRSRFDTGNWRRGLVLKPKYQYPSKAAVKSATKSGLTKKNWRHELTVPITLKKGWRGKRYPFMYEVGWNVVQFRTKVFDKEAKKPFPVHTQQEPELTMHEALAFNDKRVVDTFKRHLARNINILAQTQYKSATTALKRRR